MAYCLGQMQNSYAIPVLTRVLEDKKQEAMEKPWELLDLRSLYKFYRNIYRVTENQNKNALTNPYLSVDPAPPCGNHDINILREALLNEKLPLFKRYRAMFSLRNLGTKESVNVLAEGLIMF
ncbi:hypothetical protein KUTeg_016859 [Tegillarca granosa]|uniref:Uncharacterized protein n=1 Tax=Tegillarca granosa TaxID=220873 RepID=A0ABQ9EN16_TEGGR|nr:hypothetical protein KUTeg_016859 [Tegillarca granosa]